MLQTLKAIPLTFFSRAFYFDIVHRWKGIGIGFVFLLVLFDYGAPLALSSSLIPEFQNETERFFDSFPDIKISQGKLSMDSASPAIVEFQVTGDNGKKDSLVLLFDTSFQSNNVNDISKYLDDKKANILVTTDYFAMQKTNGSVEFHTFQEIDKEPIEIKHDKWHSIGTSIAGFIPYFIALMFIPIFAFILSITFAKALIVKLAALFFKKEPDLSGAMRLAAAAAIPPSILRILFLLIGNEALNRFHGSPSFLLWLALAIFGLWCANKIEGNAPTDVKK